MQFCTCLHSSVVTWLVIVWWIIHDSEFQNDWFEIQIFEKMFIVTMILRKHGIIFNFSNLILLLVLSKTKLVKVYRHLRHNVWFSKPLFQYMHQAKLQGWVVQNTINITQDQCIILIQFYGFVKEFFFLFLLVSSHIDIKPKNLALKHLYLHKKLKPRLTFNPRLMLNPFWTTKPRRGLCDLAFRFVES